MSHPQDLSSPKKKLRVKRVWILTHEGLPGVVPGTASQFVLELSGGVRWWNDEEKVFRMIPWHRITEVEYEEVIDKDEPKLTIPGGKRN